jgi:hypothetical protein
VNERWRIPVVPLDVDPGGEGSILLPDGRMQREARLTLKVQDVERMRLGYVCAKCMEPFEVPWPERCHVCGVAVRRDQAAYFEREFLAGVLDLTRTDWGAEATGIEERARKEKERSQ